MTGTKENIVVVEGALRMVIGANRHRLGKGDAILFDADGLNWLSGVDNWWEQIQHPLILTPVVYRLRKTPPPESPGIGL